MDDVARQIAFEKLKLDLGQAIPRRQLIREALRNGVNPAMLAVRYSVPLADVLKAKLIWEREDEMEAKRKARG